MTAIIGYYSNNEKNVHEWDPLTSDGETPALKVNATSFTFVDKIVGSNITVIHQGSLNGTDWFDLESHSHNESGVDYHAYSNLPLLYVRAKATSIGAGESFIGSVMCN
jgi:hypothetical protein